MELRANAASQSDSPATGAATFPAQHTTIGIGIRSTCCSFLATQTMVCSKMKDKIWQKARDKKHFIRDEIYWWQRERTLMGHAHILWVLLSAARIAVRALNCITYHVAEPVGVWNGLFTFFRKSPSWNSPLPIVSRTRRYAITNRLQPLAPLEIHGDVQKDTTSCWSSRRARADLIIIIALLFK